MEGGAGGHRSPFHSSIRGRRGSRGPRRSCGAPSRSTTPWACGSAPTARAVQDRIAGARDRALYYRDILLPLRERIVNEAQLQYNAMQIGIFQLLRDREQQIETGVAYVEALREYWLARADLAQIASGRLPVAEWSRVGGTGGQMK